MLYMATILTYHGHGERYIDVVDDMDCMGTDVVAGTLKTYPDTYDHGDLIDWIREYNEETAKLDNPYVIVNTVDLLMEGDLDKL